MYRWMNVLTLLVVLVTQSQLLAQNDPCDQAQVIVGNSDVDFDTTFATSDGPDHAACTQFGQAGIDHDLWYVWTADCTGEVTVETCGQTAIDTKLAIYESFTCPPAEENVLDCVDDNCGLQSSIGFTAVLGNDYLIRVGTAVGASGGLGTFSISTCAPVVGGADTCNGAEQILGSGAFEFDNQNANSDGLDHADCNFFGESQIDHDVWFCWTAGVGSIGLTVDHCGQTSVDTKVAVYEGCDCTSQANSLRNCNDDACSLQSRVDITTAPGQQYLLRIGTSPGAFGGNGTFTISEISADLNLDGQVDLKDVALFQQCYTGKDGMAAAGCPCDTHADFDGDGDVDLDDASILIATGLSGPMP